MDIRLKHMLMRYQCYSREDYENALKEIMQEIALLGLWRAKFFEKAAFYGGTALRILHGLDRFSEDLDFSLLVPMPHFSLTPYNTAIAMELQSFGLETTVDTKVKSNETAIKSAFIKANTKKQLLNIQLPVDMLKLMHRNDSIKIKMEIDTDPPGKFQTESKLLLQPIPFNVHSFQLPDLFAGKLHALLCRRWQTRVKGRDWYDLVWYLSRAVPVRLQHLQERLLQSGHLTTTDVFNQSSLINLLHQKIISIDFTAAKKDVMPFLKDPHSIALWSADFFKELTAARLVGI